MIRPTSALTLAVCLSLAGCAAAPVVPLASIDAVDRLREGPAVKEAASAAPQAIAEAALERKKADDALAAGDEVAADLYAQRALAALEDAIALARLARAADAEQKARARAEASAAEARELAAQRSKTDAENAELDKRVRIAHELGATPASGPADPKREAARKIAADSLLAQARLLCGAARLLATGPSAELDAAEKELAPPSGNDKAEGAKGNGAKGTSPGARAIDAAARARAGCLEALTRMRRGAESAASAQHADALLAELSATERFEVTRDERGVVVTMRDALDGAKLKSDAEARVADLGRVLKSHPAYRVQVVVHDAVTPKSAPDGERAKRIAAALSQAAGVPAAQVGASEPGATLPVVDPTDAKLRARNARVEIVFVSPVN